MYISLFFYGFGYLRDLHSFPTRRSSDLCPRTGGRTCRRSPRRRPARPPASPRRDRKSTRLNSSHVEISYAVFCLKKKISMPLYIVWARFQSAYDTSKYRDDVIVLWRQYE